MKRKPKLAGIAAIASQLPFATVLVPVILRAALRKVGEKGMDTYDIVMLTILIGATLFGAVKGLAWQIASLASIFASYFFAYQLRDRVSGWIKAEPPWNMFLAMLIVYVGTSLIIWLVFRLVADMIDRLRLREFDRQIGALFGFFKGGLLCIVVTLFAVTLLGDNTRTLIVKSFSGRYIARLLHDANPVMPQEVKGVLDPYIENLQRHVGEPNSAPANGSPTPSSQSSNFSALEQTSKSLQQWSESSPFNANKSSLNNP